MYNYFRKGEVKLRMEKKSLLPYGNSKYVATLLKRQYISFCCVHRFGMIARLVVMKSWVM